MYELELVGFEVKTVEYNHTIIDLTYKLNGKKVPLKEIKNLLNKQNRRIKALESVLEELRQNGYFDLLIDLIEKRNLTWEMIYDIIDEKTIKLEDIK